MHKKIIGQAGEGYQWQVGELTLKTGTIPDLLKVQTEKYGDQTLLQIPTVEGYQSVSFRAFEQRVKRIKKVLYAQGVQKESRVAFLSHNRMEFLEAAMGVWGLGATVVPLNPKAPFSGVKYMLENSGATFLVVSNAETLHVARAIKQEAKLEGLTLLVLDDVKLDPGEVYLTSEAETNPSSVLPNTDLSPEDLALILYTSGTTQTPKGVPLTHQNVLYNREAMYQAWKEDWTEEDKTLGFLPYFHVMGLPVEFLGSLYVGAQYAFVDMKKGSPGSKISKKIIASIEATKATLFSTVPAILTELKAFAQEDPDILNTLRELKFIQSGGAFLPRELGEYFQHNGVNVIQGYGMTEVGGAILLGRPKSHNWELMYPMPGIQANFVVVDGFASKQLVLDNCPTVTSGYLNNGHANKQAFPDGADAGRFYTGDLFQEKEAGFISYGRNDNVFKHSIGEKTNPLPIEQALATSPLIKQAALVGDRRPYNLAIVQPNYDALCGKQWMEIEAAIWAVLDAVNEGRLEGFEELDRHTKIHQQNLIVVGPGEEDLPTDRKGSLERTKLLKRFANQIEARYLQKQQMKAALKARRQRVEAVRVQTDGLKDIVKRTSHLDLFLAFVEERKAAEENGVTVDGAHLTIPDLVAVGQKNDITVRLTGEEAVRQGVDASVAHLKNLLDEGAHLYGVSTGFGGSADTATRQFDAVQAGLIRHLNAGFGDSLPIDVARGAMLIRANSTIKGASALRWNVIEQIIKLLNKGITPLMPKRGSLTASGDLMPLSYLAALLMGKEVAKAKYQGNIISAKEALAIAGIEPITFGPKEALALVNGTAAANSLAANVLYNTNVLQVLAQAATALSVESILGTNQSFDSFIQEMKPHRTQLEVAKNLRELLCGSKLARDEITSNEDVEVGQLRQDRYHQRTASQWLGPQLDVVLQANEAVTIEMNAATDNPLIDLKRGSVLHGGNYQGTAIAVPMDHVRLSLQALGKIVFEQYQELTNKFYSNGLPPNLAGSEDMSLDMGLKGADTLMAGYMAELSKVANPATNHVQPAELRNQSINSMALMSARYTAKAVKILQMMMASYLYAASQAIDLRNIERAYKSATKKAIRRAVKSTISSAVENAHELEQVMIVHLLKKATNPFNYAFESHTRYESLFASLVGGIRDILNGEPEAVGDIEVRLSSSPKAVIGYARQFKDALAKQLDKRLPKAKEKALQRGAGYLLGNTRPLYEFVRRDLGVKFERNDQEPGPEIQKIFDAIQDGRVIEPLLNAFFPPPPQEPVSADRRDLDLATSN